LGVLVAQVPGREQIIDNQGRKVIFSYPAGIDDNLQAQ
jgi:hypothetical protein